MNTDRRKYLTDYQRDTLRKNKKRVELLLDPQDHAALAKKAGSRSVGPFIASAALAYCAQTFVVPNEEQIHALEVAMVRIGNNLNQIAREANRSGGKLVDAEQLYGYLLEMQRTIENSLRSPPGITELVRKELLQRPAFRAELQSLMESP